MCLEWLETQWQYYKTPLPLFTAFRQFITQKILQIDKQGENVANIIFNWYPP